MDASGETQLARPVSARLFVPVFLGVVLSFGGAIGYGRYTERSIHRDALQISDSAAPSIEHLGKARHELRHIQSLVRDSRASPVELVRAREQFHDEIDAYLALPLAPEEDALRLQVTEEIKAADAALDGMSSRSSHGDVRAIVARATAAIAQAQSFNASQTTRLAHSIEDARSDSELSASVLFGASALMTIVWGYLLFRAVQRQVALIEAHRRLMQQRADELEQFAGRVAHDIMNPMGAAALALALVDRRLPEGHSARLDVARGQRSLESMRRIVDGLLEFAKAGAQPPPNVRAEVRPILEDVLADMRPDAEEARIDLSVEPFEPCVAVCSEGILASLLSNLLRNAIKYMGDRSLRRIDVRVRARRDVIHVEVVDTGPGIPPELQASVFVPYVRGAVTDKPGIGLGLATVKRIAQAHGGAVGLESMPGRGSMFWFELPSAC